MRKHYLYRLFKHSKWAGFALIIYLLATIWLFNKKIDWVLIPRNDMFSGQPIQKVERLPRLYVNNNLVRTSDMLYWKRDFLEQSMQLYKNAAVQKHTYQVDWLKRKTDEHAWLKSFEKYITPFPSIIEWYAQMSGVCIKKNDIVEIRFDRVDSTFIHHKLEIKP